MVEFRLAPRIEADSLFVLDWPLCQVRLMDDRRYPWLLLLPRIGGLEEWSALSDTDVAALAIEAKRAASAVERHARPDKINIAALGNIVRQFHLHVVGRFENDPAWPGPVWGVGSADRYPEADRAAAVALWRGRLEAD